LETYLSSQVTQAERNLEEHPDSLHKGALVRAIDRELAFRRLNQDREPDSDEFIIRTIFAPELDQMVKLRKESQLNIPESLTRKSA
jgi:hypothetical protein